MRIWEDFLQGLAAELGAEALEKWAKTLKVVHFDAGNLYLEAQDSFQLNWFEEYLRPKVRKLLLNNNQRPIKVHLSLANTTPLPDKKAWKPLLNLSPDSLDPACRFDSYFPGTTNAVSFSLLKEAVAKPSFNPIYLHGPEGTGLSHLLMACAAELSSRNQKCFYVKAGTFTNHIVAAIRSGAMQKLRQLYREHDVLLVDDIQHLAHRSATQEELFHTFNALHGAGKQIILAGTALPSVLEGIEPRLTSRFEWGLVLPFHPLNAAERKEFFKLKTEQKQIHLPSESQDFVLAALPAVSALLKAVAVMEPRKKTELSLASLQKWLAPLLDEQKRKAMTPEKIVQAVATAYEIRSSDILGRSQSQECSAPRQISMYLCRLMLKMPYLKIADVFSRDHSTVMTSVKSVDKKIREHDETVLSYINSIQNKLKS